MSDIPAGLLYTAEHEYLRKADEDGVYTLGITDYAQGELGDVVFVELPSAGDTFEHMQTFGTIEAVKAVSDLYCPVAAESVDVNSALDYDPSLVTSDPSGAGWLIRIMVSNVEALGDLMDSAGYASQVGE